MATLLDNDAIIPSPAIRLALFDIDGTLLDERGRYGPALQTQLQRIQKMGVKTAIASGRPHFATTFLVDELGLADPGVFCTGAHIFDPRKQLTLKASFLSTDIALSLVRRLRNSDMYYELYTEREYFYETPSAQVIRESHSDHLRCRPAKADLAAVCKTQQVVKLLIGAQGEAGHELLQSLAAEYANLTFAYAKFPAHPDWFFVSVISGDGCKKAAFHWLLEHYDITAAEVASFGDSQSDMTFLTLAGHGVAMGNAALEVKEVSRWETLPAGQDGVAYALKRLI